MIRMYSKKEMELAYRTGFKDGTNNIHRASEWIKETLNKELPKVKTGNILTVLDFTNGNTTIFEDCTLNEDELQEFLEENFNMSNGFYMIGNSVTERSIKSEFK